MAGLGLALVARVLGESTPPAVALARRLHPPGAAAAVASLLLDDGTAAGLLASCWLAVCICATAGGAVLIGEVAAQRNSAGGSEVSPLATVTIAVGLGYLSVGGAWLVLSRLGLRPLGLSTDIVRLTAVHFHYAGFGLLVLAATGLVATDWLASRVSLTIGCIVAIAGPPVVATGFTFDSATAQVGGAILMTVAAWTVAFGTFLLATSSTGPAKGRQPADRAARTLLVVSALSPVVPMVLAVQWALAQHTGLPALNVDDMASTHGVLNGIGFVGAGLVGWLLTGVGIRVTEPSTSP